MAWGLPCSMAPLTSLLKETTSTTWEAVESGQAVKSRNIIDKPYTSLGPIPRESEFRGYRIANNHIHHCGTIISTPWASTSLSRMRAIAHNLIHDTAYCGLVVIGNVPNNDPQLARDNTIEYNHIYNAMKVCTDGAGIYVMLPQAGRGAAIRGNLIQDVQTNPCNARTGFCFGVYLDLISENYHLENNVVYNCANGPLFFYSAAGKTTRRSTKSFSDQRNASS